MDNTEAKVVSSGEDTELKLTWTLRSTGGRESPDVVTSLDIVTDSGKRIGFAFGGPPTIHGEPNYFVGSSPTFGGVLFLRGESSTENVAVRTTQRNLEITSGECAQSEGLMYAVVILRPSEEVLEVGNSSVVSTIESLPHADGGSGWIPKA